MSYLDQRRKFIEEGRPLPVKKKYHLPKVSKKRQAKILEQKNSALNKKTEKQIWFEERRKELTGICQCGCGRTSSKYDEKNFRSSICHILPQRIFPSVALHPLNMVERNFWDGCHSNMDNRSMALWPNMADWDDIVQRVSQLSMCLSDEERSRKFYLQLRELINKN